MLCCAICIDENAQVCTATIVFRRHRWFHLTKNWPWFINHVAEDGASPSVLRMILICCIIMYWIWRVISGGPFRGPLVRWPSVPDFPGQTLFLTSSPRKNQRSPGTPICPVFGLASRICPDLTDCRVVPNWTRAVLWVLTIHTVYPDRCICNACTSAITPVSTSTHCW